MSGRSAHERIDANLQLDHLRSAIQENRVIFPLPVPVFTRQYRADIQWRLAELYLIHGWSAAMLADRYGISRSRVRQSVRHWVHRAHTLGYLQQVPPELTYLDPLAVARSIHSLREDVSSAARSFELLAGAAESELLAVTRDKPRHASAGGE